MAGAAADVFHRRIGRFSEVVERTQRSTLAYHEAVGAGGPRSAARESLMQANRDLNHRFQVELRSARMPASVGLASAASTLGTVADHRAHGYFGQVYDQSRRWLSGH